ncbi:N-acetylmuramoyl-L-alanine amidase family protein [Paenibacillus lactis]|uniref:N-acetylmuramoyl-L-alanine amidase n=1 Tax=Paenibacillus lactis TaxID=228574 RepID=A0ABS4F9N6_9BACL|nr:N-acetylmuramoyl-L-alanine amidase [Paenibacillus lactis]MBP1892970.1 N-acetylmuramoyl-L-alanine amidase [Paenibacillus lactis]HAF97558.1 N-acetylmuramoyl-L-alanine amidase [Paenibacillus lactis]
MKKVWIDAGHGGKDPGAVGNGLKEKDIALTVSLGVKRRLEAEYEGVQVLMSRSTDVFLELSERTNAANKTGADLLVSIHCNAGGGAGGFESFRYTDASAASRSLQNKLHMEIMATLKPHGVIDRGQKAKNLHMCRESRMPAVLTENLFIDVSSDADKLKRQEVIDALIDGHVKGIAKYLGLKKKEGKSITKERDINVVSSWAAPAWEEATKEGLFDGSRPGAPFTREEAAAVLLRMEKNILEKLKTKYQGIRGEGNTYNCGE